MTKLVAEVGVYEAKTTLSKLLLRVAAGEEIAITNRGEVVARLVPAVPKLKRRVLGMDRGKVVIHDDFDDPLPPEIMAAFE